MLVFVVGSMAAMGLGLKVQQILEPLRDVRLVLLLLAANFVVVPIVAVGAGKLLPMDDAASTAVIIIGCCAGAPFLPKLAQLAKGNVALSVGAMVLLMVFTVFYAPIVLPLVIQGAEVDPWDIASSLILLMYDPAQPWPAHGGALLGAHPQLGSAPPGTSPAWPCCWPSVPRSSSPGAMSSSRSVAGSSSAPPSSS